jgi:ParB-like chromosome segregation protein Spo0J
MDTETNTMMNKEHFLNIMYEHIDQYMPILELKDQVDCLNLIREKLHEHSPFKNEPVDFVKWVAQDLVIANDYNPNKVAPPEMELLEVSIMNDGYTQPIVTWPNENKVEVIDGFHRNRVGKESKLVAQRIQGYLPTVIIRKERSDKNDRIASTIRHNRARGKHQVNAMSEIVIELKNRNWTNKRIAKQLGMDEEEVLRLCQISGIEHLFTDSDFSTAWEAAEYSDDFKPVNDELSQEELSKYRIPNEKDKTRIFHTYHNWECHKSGFYKTTHETLGHGECESKFMELLSDELEFDIVLSNVIQEWKNSCEHYLTNKSMNRLAWLGQAAVCYKYGIPSRYSGAWFKLDKKTQDRANEIALKYLNKWLTGNNLYPVNIDQGVSLGRQIELY